MKNKNTKKTKSTHDIWDQILEEKFMKAGLKLVWGNKAGTSVTMYPKQSKEQESLNKSANMNNKSKQ